MVFWAQSRLREAVRHALAAVAADVANGLAETIGLEAAWCDDEPASVLIRLPPEVDAQLVAHAVDMENVEAWCDDAGELHVGIHPWHRIKDTDQTVLAITKVLHVRYNMHAPDRAPHSHGKAAKPTT